MFSFFRKKQRSLLVGEFTVFGAFIAVALAGLLYGLVVSLLRSTGPVTSYVAGPAVVAPTDEEYQAEARDVLSPFLEQTHALAEDDLAAAGPLVLELAQKTQERLLRVRVPKDRREAHLTFVLLLDQWIRALSGSRPDQAEVIDKTRTVLSANPWIAP